MNDLINSTHDLVFPQSFMNQVGGKSVLMGWFFSSLTNMNREGDRKTDMLGIIYRSMTIKNMSLSEFSQ